MKRLSFEEMLADLAAETAAREAWESSPEGRAKLAADAAAREKRDAELAAQAAREAERKAVRALLATGINLREEDAARIVRGDVHETEASRLVSRWLDPKPRAWDTLLLLGERGVGKTYAAGIALHRHPGQYLKSRRACAIFRASWGEDAERWESAMRCDLLVVDELGTARDHDVERDMAHELIDERHCRGRLTLVISNLAWTGTQNARGLRDVLDARTVDRMRDGRVGRGSLAGDSLRGRDKRGT